MVHFVYVLVFYLHQLYHSLCKNEKVAMIDLVWDVDYMLEEITAMAGTKNGWEETAGNLAKYVVEPWAVREINLKKWANNKHEKSYDFLLKDQQDNAAITIGLVEDFLVGVILGTGDKDSGWPETAGKLAEDVEQRVSQMNLRSWLIIHESLLVVSNVWDDLISYFVLLSVVVVGSIYKNL